MNSFNGRTDPWFWWGPFGEPEDPPDLARLVAGGALSPGLAGFLAAAVHHGASVATIAQPSGAGKTALLTALLPALPNETIRLHPRGSFETFRFLDDPDLDLHRTALLINELSDHLPIYLWGERAATALAARARGARVVATAHAEGAADFARTLAALPYAPPSGFIGAFDLVITLGPDRKVREVMAILPGPAKGGDDSGPGFGAIPFDPQPAAIEDLLDHSTATGSPLGDVPRDYALRWVPWALADRAPAPDPDRPGAMLAKQEQGRLDCPESP